MGGTMSTMFTALYPELVKTLTLMAAPLDFEGKEGLLQVWTDPKYFDVDALVDAFGNCPPTFLQGMFTDDEAGPELLHEVHRLLRQDGRRPVRPELLRDGEVDATTTSRSPARRSASSSRSSTSATSWSRASSTWATCRWT